MPSSVEQEFYGVYCLISRSDNSRYKNKCYIGYTVNPNRRIVQHNSGREHGGAKKTENRGPWDMVCIVHGFPNSIIALRFEWAWQNPDKSRRLKGIFLKKEKKESHFAFRIRIMSHMIRSDPWRRLSLTLRWLMPEHEVPIPEGLGLPDHVEKAYGIVEKKLTEVPRDAESYQPLKPCSICRSKISSVVQLVRCPKVRVCGGQFHARCLAEKTLCDAKEEEDTLIPLRGRCPRCFGSWFWGKLIQDQRTLLQISKIAAEELRIANSTEMVPIHGQDE